jgi:hypothetical protein
MAAIPADGDGMMIWRNAAVMLLFLAAGGTMAAPGKNASTPAPSINAGAAVGDAHRRLATLAGLWRVKQSLWLADKQAPVVDSGTAMFTMVLGDRHLQQDLRIDSSAPFQGLGYIGYDNATGRYYTSWMDINFTGVLLLHGEHDARTNTYRFEGEMRGEGGERIPTREELRVLDGNHLVVRFYETRHGRESLVVELEYAHP